VSLFVYGKEILDLHTSSLCQISGLANFIVQITEPYYWFGFLTFLLTAYGCYVLLRKGASAWPWLEDGKWLILIGVTGLFLSTLLIGCSQ
jgi:hypothetical protein